MMNNDYLALLESAQAVLEAAQVLLTVEDLQTPAAEERLAACRAALRALDPEQFVVASLDDPCFDNFPFDLESAQ